MRRLAVCAFVVLAAGLALAPGALASSGARQASLAAKHPALAGVNFQRLGDTSTFKISGNVLNYDGTGAAGAEVDWGWWDGGYNPGGTNTPLQTSPGTDSSGAFFFNPVTSAPTPNSDDLTVYPAMTDPGLWRMEYWALNFSASNDATPYSYQIQPAHVDLDIKNAPASYPMVEVKAGLMSAGNALTDVVLSGETGVAGVLPPSFDDVIAYVFGSGGNCTAQTEWLGTSPVSVAAGATATDTVNLDFSRAQHAYLSGPTCRHSGKPGTKVKMVLKGWPTKQQAEFTAWYGTYRWDYNSGNPLVTSAGQATTYTVPLTIRTNAPVDEYEVDTNRVDAYDSFVGLWDFFQVCTFKSSASAIHHGGAVRLSGKVPAGAGYAIIYWRHKISGQPGTLAAKGWVKGGRYRIGSEKFKTGLLHPTRTTWYVAKYTGFDFPAFTSVIKVAVR